MDISLHAEDGQNHQLVAHPVRTRDGSGWPEQREENLTRNVTSPRPCTCSIRFAFFFPCAAQIFDRDSKHPDFDRMERGSKKIAGIIAS